MNRAHYLWIIPAAWLLQRWDALMGRHKPQPKARPFAGVDFTQDRRGISDADIIKLACDHNVMSFHYSPAAVVRFARALILESQK